MIKKFFFLASILFVVGGCTTAPTTTVVERNPIPDNYEMYQDEMGWQIAYPSDWDVEQSVYNDRQVFFYTPKATAEEFDHNVGVLYSPEGDQFGSATELLMYAEQTQDEDPNTVVESTDLIDTPLGLAAVINYTAHPEGWNLKAKEVAILHGSEIYFLVLTAEPEMFDQYEPDFMSMINSLIPITE